MLLHENNGEWNVIPEKIFHSLEKVKVKKNLYFDIMHCTFCGIQ